MSGPKSNKSFLVGCVLTAIFYAFVHSPLLRHSFIHTYTTEHITEYAIVGIFFWVTSEMFFSFLGARVNSAACKYEWLPTRAQLESPENAVALLDIVKTGPPRFQHTMIARRLKAALTYVSERKSAKGFREYLTDLANNDADEVYARYSFPRFCTALLPILGLLGTVVHFGTALSGLSADELASKIPEIVSGMGTAFNTTCAALTASVTTMLLRFVAEHHEEGIVVQINGYVQTELLHRFRATESDLNPWEESLLETQASTLQAFDLYSQKCAQMWSAQMLSIGERFLKTDLKREENFRVLVEALDRIQREFIREMKLVQTDFHQSSRIAHEIADTLNSDGHLIQLQDRLVQNLEALRQSQQLDTAMHELTGAIHLLTARQSQVPRAA